MEKSPTETELARIDRGEKDYADQFWEVCHVCNGSGEHPPGTNRTCGWCKGVGEVKYRPTVFEVIQNKIDECTKKGIAASNDQFKNDMLQQSEALLWVLRILSVEAAESFAVIEDKIK